MRQVDPLRAKEKRGRGEGGGEGKGEGVLTLRHAFARRSPDIGRETVSRLLSGHAAPAWGEKPGTRSSVALPHTEGTERHTSTRPAMQNPATVKAAATRRGLEVPRRCPPPGDPPPPNAPSESRRGGHG